MAVGGTGVVLLDWLLVSVALVACGAYSYSCSLISIFCSYILFISPFYSKLFKSLSSLTIGSSFINCS